MIEIRSYLKDGERFVPIEAFQGVVACSQYIEGAIELVIDGIPLITMDMWDYVDQIWEYLVDGALRIISGDEASMFFPDQPIEVKMRPAWGGDGIDLEVLRKTSRQRTSTGLREFLDAFCDAGTIFFERMMVIVPENEASDRQALTKLGRLRGAIQ